VSQPTKPAKRGRRTIARHGELKSPHPLSLLLKVLGIIVAVGLVSSAGVAAYAAYDITASFTEDAVDLEGQAAVPPDIGAIEGGVNLLVAGTDECLPEFAAPDRHGAGSPVYCQWHGSGRARGVGPERNLAARYARSLQRSY